MKKNITPQQMLKSDLKITADENFVRFKFIDNDVQILIRWEIMRYGYLGDFEVINKKEYKEYLQEIIDDENEKLENKPYLKKIVEILRFTEDKYILLNNKTGVISANTHNKTYFIMTCFDIISSFSKHMISKENEFNKSIKQVTNNAKQYTDDVIHDMFMKEYLNPGKHSFHNYIIGCEFNTVNYLKYN